MTPGEPELSLGLFLLCCFASWWDGGHSLGCWNAGKSREHRGSGSVCHSWIMGVIPVLPVFEALKAGGDSGLHKTGGERSSLGKPGFHEPGALLCKTAQGFLLLAGSESSWSLCGE